MKSSSMLFSDPMIRAIRRAENPKNQTRRLKGLEQVNKAPDEWEFGGYGKEEGKSYAQFMKRGGLGNCEKIKVFAPYGTLGDEIWVKECFGQLKPNGGLIYRADGGFANAPNIRTILEGGKWKPSIFCGREQSRIRLNIITYPRLERLQDISEDDALAEGAFWVDGGEEKGGWANNDNDDGAHDTARESFRALWDAINDAPGVTWAANPWLWVYSFERKE